MKKISALPSLVRDIVPIGAAAFDSARYAKHIPQGALCHALQIRLSGGHEAEALRDRFARDAGNWNHGRAQPVLWDDLVPMEAASAAAARRRAAEYRLPLDPDSGSGLRATLLRYTDGLADLILVADRRIVSAPGLRRFAMSLFRPDGEARASGSAIASTNAGFAIADRRTVTYPEWGLGGASPEPGWGIANGRPFPAALDPVLLFAAIGFTMSCFDSHTEAVLGLVGYSDNAATDQGAATGNLCSVLRIDPRTAVTVAQLLEAAKANLQSMPVTGPNAEQSGVAVGMIWDIERSELAGCGIDGSGFDGFGVDGSSVEYRACLAPLFPLTIDPKIDPRGCLSIDYHFERMHFSAAMVKTFDRVVVSVYAALTAANERADSRDAPLLLDSLALLDTEFATTTAASGRGQALFELGRPTRTVRRIEQRIAQNAARHPNADAVSYEGKRLSYGELAHLSDRIAATLQDLGVQPGDRVGVCMERSLELVPILLAIFKAGAAYVPVDPMYPAERIAFVLRDAQPSFVIGADANLKLLDGIAVPALSVESLLERAAEIDRPPLDLSLSGDAAAYIIYTSGSTGRPKGVVVPHRNVDALIAATEQDFSLSISDTWAMFHSSAFDFSVWEIWGCLATGGHLVVVPYWVTRSPAEFVQLLMEKRVTVLNQTPSAFAQLREAEMTAAEMQAGARLPLRLVIFGGETLDSRILLPWFDRYPESSCRLVNMFGITETTVHVTAETITRHHALTHSRSVGRAIPGWHVYIMDARGQLLPPGVIGEIYVGGAGVALHYLNREELTAQRFLPDPHASDSIHRTMYRSGDRGRMRADGRIEHLGRLDSQVKIRGFRIELDEIRSILLECPGVSAAAVVVNLARPEDNASARLDAYVVLEQGDASDIRRQAARKLPDHMVPGTVTVIDAMPLTTNGKLDVARLPAPVIGRAPLAQIPGVVEVPLIVAATKNADSSDDAGNCTLTMAMQAIWADVLQVEVACEDNFFDLGGNSLFAMRIAAVMRERGLPSVPMRELYLHQNIRAIVQNLRAQ